MSRIGDSAVVVSGEALIDLVLARDGTLEGHPGGGPYNVARTIGRLGQAVPYLGRVSADGFGARLRRQLESDGVDLGSVIATDAPTTLALAELDATGAAVYHFYDAGTSAPGLTLAAAQAALPERVDVFYLGTLGLVFEPMATTLETLVAAMPAATLVALDPNCRPSVIDDPAAFRGRLRRPLARTDVIKASADDLAWIDPGTDPVTAARRLLPRSDALALVTLGGAGAVAVNRERTSRSPRRRSTWSTRSVREMHSWAPFSLTGASAGSAARSSDDSTTSSRRPGSPVASRP